MTPEEENLTESAKLRTSQRVLCVVASFCSVHIEIACL